jgi:hypothetical protein
MSGARPVKFSRAEIQEFQGFRGIRSVVPEACDIRTPLVEYGIGVGKDIVLY